MNCSVTIGKYLHSCDALVAWPPPGLISSLPPATSLCMDPLGLVPSHHTSELCEYAVLDVTVVVVVVVRFTCFVPEDAAAA